MILEPYRLLGLPDTEDADDDRVRQAYLKSIREYPPEQHPEKFAAIRAAFEKLKTAQVRADYRLFQAGSEVTLDRIIEEVECMMPRPRPTFRQLLAATEPEAT